MVKTFQIGSRRVGTGAPCFVIAEAGVNHNGERSTARRLIDAAVAAGADAVKFQTFRAEQLATRQAPKAAYQKKSGRAGESQWAMLKRLELSAEDHSVLFDYAKKRKILFLSTPFDFESADFLERLGILAFKIGSGEITNWPFLAHIAGKKKPVILSSGMSTLEEVRAAVRVIEKSHAPLALLHCVSNYPARPAEANLRAMDTLSEAFSCPIGFSDHTLGLEVAFAAVARGACVLEKHLTLDRSAPGPDHRASLEPREFKALVKGVRIIEASLGHGRKEPVPSEKAIARVARKSLVATTNIPAGSRLQRRWLGVKRPGTGLSPAFLEEVIGRTAKRDIPGGALLTKEMFS